MAVKEVCYRDMHSSSSIWVDGIATKPHLRQATFGFGLSFLCWGLEERTPNSTTSAAFASGSTRAET